MLTSLNFWIGFGTGCVGGPIILFILVFIREHMKGGYWHGR